MMRLKSKLIRLGAAFIVVLIVLSTPRAVLSQTTNTEVLVSPAESTATTCASHTIAVRVQNVENLTAFELLIYFDPAVVEITDVVNGDFLLDPDEGALYSPENNDGSWNEDAYISFGLAQQRNAVSGELNPKSGSGDLVLITMQALVPGASTTFEIDDEESMLVWWGEDPGEENDPVDGSLIEFTASDGVVNAESCPPTAIELSKASVPENEPVGTEVGLFTTTDPDMGDSFTYTLVSVGDYPDNRAFSIDGNRLLTAESFNYEAQSSYTIKVRSTDAGGKYVEEEFSIDIKDVNDPPSAHNQTVDTVEEAPVDITLTGFDEDDDALTFDVVTNPTNGTLEGTAPDLTYTPQEGLKGVDTFTFTVSDHDFTSDPATVTIIVGDKYSKQYFFPLFAQ